MPASRLAQRIGIVGTGVAGLAAAHGLHRAGFRHIRVFDRAPSLAASSPGLRGGPVIVGGNGVRVLDRWGLLPELWPRAHVLDGMRARTATNQGLSTLSSAEMTGGRARSLSSDSRPGPPLSSLAVQGSVLSDVLCHTLPKEVDVSFGCELRLHFYDDPKDQGEEYDLVIGADGLHSPLRALVPSLAREPRKLDAVYVRATMPAVNLYTAEGKPLRETDELTEFWGAGRKIAFYFVDPNTIAWLATLHESFADTNKMNELFSSFPAPVPTLIRATVNGSTRVVPVEVLEPTQTPFDEAKRLVLIGEAAHAAPQELWQNIALDLEDAAMLALLLERQDRKTALQTWSEMRYPRVSHIVNSALDELNQAMTKGKIAVALRDTATSMMPASVVRDKTHDILSYDAIARVEERVPKTEVDQGLGSE